MTDIWRSFVAHGSVGPILGCAVPRRTLRHDRNEHNLLRDFEAEVPGYLHNQTICEALSRLEILPGVDKLASNLKLCYEELVRLKFVGEQELDLLDAWRSDIDAINQETVSSESR